MKQIFKAFYWLILFFIVSILFWLLGDIVFYIIYIGVIASLFISKVGAKGEYFIIEIGGVAIYLILGLFAIFIKDTKTLKLVLAILGSWIIYYILENKT